MTADEKLKTYIPMIEATTSLLAPFLEIAIHDLTTGKICAIYHNLSNRNVGDPSPLKELGISADKFPDVFDPYYETNWNGHKIKCTTVTVRDENRKPLFLICFNFDTYVFQDIQLNLKTFLEVKKSSDNPVEIFNENWQEKIDRYLVDYLTHNKLLKNNLSRQQKQNMVEELSKHGVFFYKNGANYVAKQLNLSRATIYNYLKVLRSNTS